MREGKAKELWRRVKFGEIAENIQDRVDDPSSAGVERYVGLEHIDPGSLKIPRWGAPSDVGATKLRFRAGDIIFGRRRAYQRKLAVADFDGICSAHALVLREKPGAIVPGFLPFFMQSDVFMERAVAISVGSLSPTINWTALREQEFALPPIETQATLVAALSAGHSVVVASSAALEQCRCTYQSLSVALFCDNEVDWITGDAAPTAWAMKGWDFVRLGSLTRPDSPICYGIVQVGESVPDGIPVLRTDNLNGNYSDVIRVSADLHHQYRRSSVSGGEILVAIQGASTGKIGVVPANFVGNVNRHLARIRITEKVSASFFWHLWRSPPYQRYVRATSVGSTKPELPIRVMREMWVPAPSKEEQQRACNALDAMTERIDELSARASKARALFRAMLETTLHEPHGESP